MQRLYTKVTNTRVTNTRVTKCIAAFIAAASSISFAAPAYATVTTTSCASTNECTLSEFYGGSSNSVNDVAFDSSALNFDYSTLVDLDPAQLFISGIDETSPGVLGLDNNFSPERLIQAYGAIDYDWRFNASINSGMRTISGAELSMTDARVIGDAFARVSADMLDGSSNKTGLIQVFQNQGGRSSPGAMSNLTAMTTALFDVDIQDEGIAAGNLAGLTAFQSLLTFGSPGAPPMVAPIPAAFPLMLAGIIGLFLAMGRHKKRET